VVASPRRGGPRDGRGEGGPRGPSSFFFFLLPFERPRSGGGSRGGGGSNCSRVCCRRRRCPFWRRRMQQVSYPADRGVEGLVVPLLRCRCRRERSGSGSSAPLLCRSQTHHRERGREPPHRWSPGTRLGRHVEPATAPRGEGPAAARLREAPLAAAPGDGRGERRRGLSQERGGRGRRGAVELLRCRRRG
jgi:hypothetical protein